MNHSVQNNVLNTHEYEMLNNLLFSGDFPWFYTLDDSGKAHFKHILYMSLQPQSDLFNALGQVFDTIEISALINFRAFLDPGLGLNPFAQIIEKKPETSKTGILFLRNTDSTITLGNSPDTYIEVPCVANSLLTFDGVTPYFYTPSAQPQAYLVFNYYK